MRRPSSLARRREGGLVDEHRVRGVGGEAPLLGADQHDDGVGLQERHVRREHGGGLARGEVLDQVRGQQAAEQRSGLLPEELVDGERGQPRVAADLHGGGVVVDADAARGQVRQVAADATADVERAALPQQAAQVPPVGRLDVEDALPSGAGAGREAAGVGGGGGAAVGYGHVAHPTRGRRSNSAGRHCARARVAPRRSPGC